MSLWFRETDRDALWPIPTLIARLLRPHSSDLSWSYKINAHESNWFMLSEFRRQLYLSQREWSHEPQQTNARKALNESSEK